MRRTLQRRFLVLLLLPVTLVFLIAGLASFFYAQSYLLEEWSSVTRLKLEKTAHQIAMRLEKKRDLMELIAEAAQTPDSVVTQTFLIQKLKAQPGVSFVDVEPIKSGESKPVKENRADALRLKGADRQSTFELLTSERKAKEIPEPPKSGAVRMGSGRKGMMMPHHMGTPHRGMPAMRHRPFSVSLDESGNYLSIIRTFDFEDGAPTKRIVAKVAFSSFMKGLLGIGEWKGSVATLVNKNGLYLAGTAPAFRSPKRLGEWREPLEKRVLDEMQRKTFGTVMGPGNVPDRIIGFYKVESTDWFLILVSEGRVVMAPIIRFRVHYAVSGVLALACIAFLIRWSTRPVAQSIAEISGAASKVETGDYDIGFNRGCCGEVDQLQSSFSHMVDGLKRMDLIEQTFGRYVDKKVAEDLMNRPDALKLGGVKRTVTILMADLRGFTPVAEKLLPENVITIVNRYFSRMIKVIEEYSGIIVDFYGDSVLVFFNGMARESSQPALDAVKCAARMQEEMGPIAELNKGDGLPILGMGVGIHTGEVVVGNIGSHSRAKYGIVGSAVNETQRIQASAGEGEIVISMSTYELLPDGMVRGSMRQADLKGLEGPRDLFGVESVKQ